MGEARKRKLLGIYPAESKPEARPLPERPDLPERQRVCENCLQSGGTLVANALGNYIHSPDCQYAAAAKMRQEHRQSEYTRKFRERWLRTRRLLRSGPAKPADDETTE